MNEVSKLLNDAADVLVSSGWCQGYYNDDQGRHCLVGALYQAVDQNYEIVIEAKERVRCYLGLNPFSWNDAKGRTQKQVVDVLRSAAQL